MKRASEPNKLVKRPERPRFKKSGRTTESPVTQKERFSTPPELARTLGISTDSILNFIRRGELRAINTSNGSRPRWKISPEDFQKFLDSRSNKSKAEPKRIKRRKLPAVKQYV